MSRMPRIFIDYACYHIITKGNQKQQVFREEKDYEKYLEIIRKAKKKYGILLYAYCLMLNHLLIEAEKAVNISKFMQWINRGVDM